MYFHVSQRSWAWIFALFFCIVEHKFSLFSRVEFVIMETADSGNFNNLPSLFRSIWIVTKFPPENLIRIFARFSCRPRGCRSSAISFQSAFLVISALLHFSKNFQRTGMAFFPETCTLQYKLFGFVHSPYLDFNYYKFYELNWCVMTALSFYSILG